MHSLHDIPGRHVLTAHIATEAALSGNSTHAIGILPFRAVVKAVKIAFDTAITGNDTNYIDLEVAERRAYSPLGTDLEIATHAFTAGNNATAHVIVSLTMNTTNTADPFRPGTVFVLVKTEHGGAGMVLPDLTITVEFEGGGDPPTTSTSTSTTTTSSSTSTSTTTSTSTSTSTTTTTSTSSSTSTSSTSTSTTTTTSTSTSTSTTTSTSTSSSTTTSTSSSTSSSTSTSTT